MRFFGNVAASVNELEVSRTQREECDPASGSYQRRLQYPLNEPNTHPYVSTTSHNVMACGKNGLPSYAIMVIPMPKWETVEFLIDC